MSNERRVVIILFGPGSIGGTERRISSYCSHVSKQDSTEILLITNNELEEALTRVGMRPDCRTVVLRSWFGHKSCHNAAGQTHMLLTRIVNKVRTVTTHVFLSVQLGLALLAFRPDVVHLVLDSARFAFLPLLRANRAGLIVSLVGSETRDFLSLSRLDSYALTQCLKKADLVDCLSEELRDLALRYRLAPENKVRVHGSFVEIDRFIPSDKRPWVVFAARLIREKNPEMFLKAIPIVMSEMGPSVRFFLLGTGPMEQYLNDRAVEMGIGSCTTVGFRDDISRVLRHSLVFCSLQDAENYPSRSLLEAMSCANAVVATDVGYTYKLVNASTGIRIPNDFHVLANEVIALLKDQEKTLALGRNARNVIIGHFSARQYCDSLLRSYGSVAKCNVETTGLGDCI